MGYNIRPRPERLGVEGLIIVQVEHSQFFLYPGALSQTVTLMFPVSYLDLRHQIGHFYCKTFCKYTSGACAIKNLRP
jgi:hypothetical protein